MLFLYDSPSACRRCPPASPCASHCGCIRSSRRCTSWDSVCLSERPGSGISGCLVSRFVGARVAVVDGRFFRGPWRVSSSCPSAASGSYFPNRSASTRTFSFASNSSLLVLAGLNAFVFHRTVGQRKEEWDRVRSPLSRQAGRRVVAGALGHGHRDRTADCV